MKTAILAFALLSLAGCHVGSSKNAAPVDQAGASSSAADKAMEKSRNAMLDKNMSVDSTHWAAPATASSMATPVNKSDATGATSGASAPSSAATPAASKTGH